MKPCETRASTVPSRGTVLVVDDNAVNRLLMLTMLTKVGWPVATADSADAAMAMLEGGLRPCLIFMDVKMPVVDGFLATRRIRAWEGTQRLAAVPIVALTADVLDETRTQAAASGMTGFMTKPVSLEQIRATLSKLPAH